MKRLSAPPDLGQNILIITDNCPACLDILRAVVSELPDIAFRFFTLFHSCPTVYWEHGGADNPEVEQEIAAMQKAEQFEFELTDGYFAECRSILQRVGVPLSHIQTKVAVEEDSFSSAILSELEHGHYSGIITSADHAEPIGRLRKKEAFRSSTGTTSTQVWMIDEEDMEIS